LAETWRTKMGFTTILMRTTNTVSGAPRGVYVTYENGRTVATYRETYAGPDQSIENPDHAKGYKMVVVRVTPAEWKYQLAFENEENFVN